MKLSPMTLLLLASGCGTPSAELPPQRIEIAQIAPAMAAFRETRAIDIGEPEARTALWSGWGPDERNETDSFVWGGGERSRLRFWVVDRRERVVRLRGWAYPFADGRGVEVGFSLNGREIARRTVPPAATTLQLELPAGELHLGENFLELTYSRAHSVAGDPPWAVAWDGIQFDGGERRTAAEPSLTVAPEVSEAGTSSAGASSAAIDLPAGSGV